MQKCTTTCSNSGAQAQSRNLNSAGTIEQLVKALQSFLAEHLPDLRGHLGDIRLEFIAAVPGRHTPDCEVFTSCAVPLLADSLPSAGVFDDSRVRRIAAE